MAGRVHEVRVDFSRPQSEQPGKGHNRFHPRIPPILRLDPGDEAVLEVLDGADGQIKKGTTEAEFVSMVYETTHPLTGPVWVNGAQEGDLLEVEILDAIPDNYGWSGIMPGFGFLRDQFLEPWVVHWDLDGTFATSEQIPGVRIPEASFPGVIGVAPSEALLRRQARREQKLADDGFIVLLPTPEHAIPGEEPMASEGLRTMPPRENGGNLDTKELVKGTTVYFPVFTEGALLSIGDAHFAQGDGESCGMAIEMAGTFHLRFGLHEGAARERNIRTTQYLRRVPAAPREYYATTGHNVRGDDVQEPESATLAAYNALTAMVDHLEWRGFTRQQAYVICSVAVDLRLSEVVGLPNFTVSALVPTDIFV